MFKALVHKIMVGAPSDVNLEVNAVFEAIFEWNRINSESKQIVLLPSYWKTDAFPTLTDKPQKAINKQLVDKSDMLICIFGSKIGTPTEDNISGTVEEIEEHRKANKPVMVFFKKELDSSVEPDQILRLLEFKKNLNGLYEEFSSTEDFKTIVFQKLSLSVNENFFGLMAYNETDISNTPVINDAKTILKDSDIESLKIWIESGGEESHTIDFIGDKSMILLGHKNIDVQNARERVSWNGFFERLLNLSFIEIIGYTNKQNKPKYRLKEAAYEYIDNLNN